MPDCLRISNDEKVGQSNDKCSHNTKAVPPALGWPRRTVVCPTASSMANCSPLHAPARKSVTKTKVSLKSVNVDTESWETGHPDMTFAVDCALNNNDISWETGCRPGSLAECCQQELELSQSRASEYLKTGGTARKEVSSWQNLHFVVDTFIDCPVHTAPDCSRRQLDSEATLGLTNTVQTKDADGDHASGVVLET